MKTRSEKGSALFYTRDSGGKHEMTPGEYVNWARKTSQKLAVKFQGTPETIDKMIRSGKAVEDDLYLDFGVKGNTFVREGLDALKDRIKRDLEVSHLLIPRRDRLSRPDDPVDALVLEREFSSLGITLVFMDRIVPPLTRGKRPEFVEQIVAMIDYHQSGDDRRKLSEKMIHAQIALAKRGYSTGGRPCYGFKRCLVCEDGTKVRDLEDGEIVRLAGHHVAWLPEEGNV
ncbi:Hypothetical protein PBC10988_3260 [Planctomycetales bacterium 10988]|nr:Hypothetical protein PBC10988_3260 [Planctomycetales bacterium 10988]